MRRGRNMLILDISEASPPPLPHEGCGSPECSTADGISSSGHGIGLSVIARNTSYTDLEVKKMLRIQFGFWKTPSGGWTDARFYSFHPENNREYAATPRPDAYWRAKELKEVEPAPPLVEGWHA